MRLFLAIIAFAVLGSQAIGSEDAKSRCAALKIDKTRLACYDALFRATDTSSEQKPDVSQTLPNVDHWAVSTKQSPINDARNVILSTDAKEPTLGRFGNLTRATLLIACRENTTSLWIHFGGHFMSDYQHGTVTYRIDTAPAKKKRFRESNNHEALGLWDGRSSIPVIKSLFDHQKLFVRATPHSESAIDVEFNLTGLADVIKPLREECHW
ncbi:type VI secretion system-associated protein TagO [Thalassovita sp.]|uniref:type VI secretion system-associated protein TagO n=1 Tax=Thalassovita sp. TaxID=1979401 RepID=UPI002B2710E3|nr:type VI secretion system-associated protein TagO [Thalassovita sp.]